MKTTLILLAISTLNLLSAPPVPDELARVAGKANFAFHAVIDDQGKLKLKEVWAGNAKDAEKHISYYNSNKDGKIILKMLTDIGTTGMIYMRHLDRSSGPRREGLRNVGKSFEMWERSGSITSSGQNFSVSDLKVIILNHNTSSGGE